MKKNTFIPAIIAVCFFAGCDWDSWCNCSKTKKPVEKSSTTEKTDSTPEAPTPALEKPETKSMHQPPVSPEEMHEPEMPPVTPPPAIPAEPKMQSAPKEAAAPKEMMPKTVHPMLEHEPKMAPPKIAPKEAAAPKEMMPKTVNPMLEHEPKMAPAPKASPKMAPKTTNALLDALEG